MTKPFAGTPLLTEDQRQRIHESALAILSEVGLHVTPELRDVAERKGLPVHGERVYPAPELLNAFADEHRRRLAASRGQDADPERRLSLNVSSYHHHVHDIETGQVIPFSTERLIEMTRFADALAERGVHCSVPGFPADVPAALHPLLQYRIGAEYSRRGGQLEDITAPWIMEHLFAMAEVMDAPIRALPVYGISPLRLGGESLDIALYFQERLESIHVSFMPAAGATAPIEPLGALALSAAEALGGAVILSLATSVPVYFSLAVFPFDLRATTMVFGSPENLLLRAAAAEMNAFYGHTPAGDRGLGDLYVMAKLPDAQAAAEKASLMTAAALLGQRSFSGAGSLSMDDIFSPEQLLIDCEIRDHVQRLLDGLDTRESGQDWVQMVKEGCERGFVGLDSTLDNYQRLYWYPRLFDRGAFGAWERAGRPHLHERTFALYHEALSHYSYELDAVRRTELHRIWERALRKWASAS